MLPGRTLSGQCAKYMSSPTLNPLSSKIPFIVVSVDSGAIVDSTMIVSPFFISGNIDLHADITKPKSQDKSSFLNGVGTVII